MVSHVFDGLVRVMWPLVVSNIGRLLMSGEVKRLPRAWSWHLVVLLVCGYNKVDI